MGSRLTALNVGPFGRDVPVEPQPGDRERRRDRERRPPAGPARCGCRDLRGRRDERPQRARVEGEHQVPGGRAPNRSPTSTRHRRSAVGAIALAGRARADVGAVLLQVGPRTAPRCSSGSRCRARRSRCPPGCRGSSSGTSRSARRPTAPPGRAKNDRAKASNSIAWARSDMPSSAQELVGGHVVERGGGALPVVGQQLGGQRLVGAQQVAQPEAGGAGEQGQQVQRRRRRAGP